LELAMLTDQQVNHFKIFGFLVMRNTFSPDEVARIRTRFDMVLERDRQGRQFDGARRQGVLGCVEQDEELFRLLEDDRIYGPMEQLLGPGFVWITSDGNLYVGDTNWHPDSPTVGDFRIKIAFYLDPVERDSGCLRVVPGSHLPGFGERLRELPRPAGAAADSAYGVKGSEIPCVSLESEPGDMVIFDQRLFHASFGGKTGRRMFTMNFVTKPVEESDYDRLRQMYVRNIEHANEIGRSKRERIYTPDFLEAKSPRIQGMIRDLVALGLD
jgi:ectoine hydroxylase-related dioxygenase (phytanoyl-CoA dioxygenase family)